MWRIYGIVVLYLVWSLYKYYSRLRKNYPVGPIPLPLVGNLHQLDPTNPATTLDLWGKQYEGIYTIMMGNVPTVVITDAKLMKEAMLGPNGDAMTGRTNSFTDVILARGKNGILSSDGELWRTSRRFAMASLRNLGFGRNTMEVKVNKHLDWLLERMDTFVGVEEGYCPTADLRLGVGNIITDVLYGYDHYDNPDAFFALTDRLDDTFSKLRSVRFLLIDMCPSIRTMSFDPYHFNAMTANQDLLFDYMQECIDKHKDVTDLTDTAKESDDFIEAFLRERRELGMEASPLWSDAQLCSILVDLWTAGMETTVTTSKWTLLFMLANPRVQAKARAEIKDVIGLDRQPCMTDRQSMPYMQALIAESQRCANILPINLFHRCTRDIKLSNGVHIMKDTTVIPQISSVLQSKEIFGPDAGDFRPERFLSADGLTMDKEMLDNMVAFSLGKRQCMGESLARVELFLITTRILQRFTLEAMTQEVNLKPVFGATMHPNKYHVKLGRTQ